MNLPWRLTACTSCPSALRAVFPQALCVKQRTFRIRRPVTRGPTVRTTVSTSGSSGIPLIVADADTVNRDMLRACMALALSAAAFCQTESAEQVFGPFLVGDRNFRASVSATSLRVQDELGVLHFEKKITNQTKVHVG